MVAKYFNPYTDFGFKKLFGEVGSKDLLIDFLNQLLPIHHQIQQLTFKNTENLPDTIAERKAIFDIYCESRTGDKFIVEMQEQYEQYKKSLVQYLEIKNVFDTAFEEGEKVGIEKGEKVGIEQGIERGIEKVAKALKEQNIAIEIIVESTGLSYQAIQRI
jgi:flagellar biosynthesis/type III secretory pathway protein FliH